MNEYMKTKINKFPNQHQHTNISTLRIECTKTTNTDQQHQINL